MEKKFCSSKVPKSISEFYQEIIQLLNRHRVEFLVGGAFALKHLIEIHRFTKDMDIFVATEEIPSVIRLFCQNGYSAEEIDPIWLAKIYNNGSFVDVIHRTGNGLAAVDSSWFSHAERGTLFGEPVWFMGPEEVIWSKAFTMERDRFDLADILHVIKAKTASLDWNWLLQRFTDHEHILLTYLILFDYAYPYLRNALPQDIVRKLSERVLNRTEPEPGKKICRGTLLSRSQFLVDILEHGDLDARFHGALNLPDETLDRWHREIFDESA